MKKRAGFFLIEILLGIAVFAIFLAGIAMTLIYGQENTLDSGDRTRGAYLTERTMEGVRAIRDGSFAAVTTGTKGIWVSRATNLWAFSGTTVTASGSFIVKVTIASKASDWMIFTGSTVWKHGYHGSGAVRLMGEITDWKTPKTVGNWATSSVEGSVTPGGTPQFNRVAVAGTGAYVTCEAVAGLYMFNIANTAAPVRVNTAFSIGFGATGVAVRGQRLYVLTKDPNAELKVYRVVTGSSPVLVTSYNLPGSALGTDVSIGYNLLYVTASSPSPGQNALYSFDISNSGSLVSKQGIFDTTNLDTWNGVALSGTSAYLASTMDAGELRLAHATSTGGLTLRGSYNLSDRVLDGTVIAIAGTSALLGTQRGDGFGGRPNISEVVLFDVRTSGIPSSAWYHEGSGTIMGLGMDACRAFGFVVDSSYKKAFQVFDLKNKATLSEYAPTYTATGLGRGLSYDYVRDRVYVLTDDAFLIFRPTGAGSTACQ